MIRERLLANPHRLDLTLVPDRAWQARVDAAFAERMRQRRAGMTDADAEQMETQHWVGEALDCGYLTPADATRLNAGLEEIGRMLNSMMEKSDQFCGSPDGVLHEDPAEYFTDAD